MTARLALVAALALAAAPLRAQLPESPRGDPAADALAQLSADDADDAATTLALEVEPHRLVGAGLISDGDAAAYLARFLLTPQGKGAKRACDPANAACRTAAEALAREGAPQFVRLQARLHAERLANGFRQRMTEDEIAQVRRVVDTPAARKFIDALLAYRRGAQDAAAAFAGDPVIGSFHQQIYDYFVNQTADLPKARK